MADPTPLPPVPEPPKATDASQKKQTVRISLPPKPAGGPAIKIPVAAPAPTVSAQTAAAAPAAPSAPRPAPPPAAAPKAAPTVAAPPRPAAATVSPLDLILAFATVVVGICIIVRLLFLVPSAS